MLRPLPGGSAGLVVEIPNRGGARIPYGDGFLLGRGWTVTWCGWHALVDEGFVLAGDAEAVVASCVRRFDRITRA